MPGIKKTMEEFKAGDLHSGSKHGPKVKSRAQAIAIGLSEERKAGHPVAKKHHHEATAPGHMGAVHDHAEPVGHKTHAGVYQHDGAGRKGHDMEMHHRTEHKAPTHPEGSHAPMNPSPGPMGHPGQVMKMDHDGGDLVGGDYSQTSHEPAVLKTPDGQGFTAGHPGVHAGMGSKPHGFVHAAHQRQGVHRVSGHPGAHRIGKR